jgi:hypothetical protein
MQLLDKDDQELLNYCTKYLARGNRFTEAPPSSSPTLTPTGTFFQMDENVVS